MYDNYLHLLFVGEGDFSFSLAVAMKYGNGSRITATTMDSKIGLFGKYSSAKVRKTRDFIIEILTATIQSSSMECTLIGYSERKGQI